MQDHGDSQPNQQCLHVHPPGTLLWLEDQKLQFALFFIMYTVIVVGNLLIILAISSRHPCVFPLSSYLHWRLLHNNHHSQDADELSVEVKVLCWVYDSDVFFLAFAHTEWTSWQPWPFTTRWPSVTFPLHDHHEPLLLCPTSGLYLFRLLPSFLLTSSNKLSSLLGLQCYLPIPLWYQLSAEIVLLLHIWQCNCN